MRQAIVQSAQHLTNVAVADGQDVADAPLYGNYAIDSTPLERLYGEDLSYMRSLKHKYDARNVMGLAGGWKF